MSMSGMHASKCTRNATATHGMDMTCASANSSMYVTGTWQASSKHYKNGNIHSRPSARPPGRAVELGPMKLQFLVHCAKRPVTVTCKSMDPASLDLNWHKT
jgi:hypothetical protein